MVNILLAFITGITTGGLSCLAVQGGLLASSLASQIEKDLGSADPQVKPANKVSKRKQRELEAQLAASKRQRLARPIVAFLAAKLLAYTLLGFLLGLVGQVFQLSPYARAFLQIAIGIFMLGNALRMLNVHPIFRYFVFEPPAFLRRKLRKTAQGADDSLLTPFFLGFMTVLIPCGVTQAMMAVALSAGSPIEGAALMFAFTLGTSPVFFAVAYFATQLGAKVEKHFMRFAAVVVLILALVTIDSGITLAGSPVSFTRAFNSILVPAQGVQAEAPSQGPIEPATSAPQANPSNSDGSVITVKVENYGYNPDVIHAKAGEPITLRLVSENVRSCSRAFVIPSLGVQQILPQTGEVEIEIPAQKAGTEMPFMCSMAMYTGIIVFDL